MRTQSYIARILAVFCLICLIVVAGTGIEPVSAQDEDPSGFLNPLNPYNGADPWLVYYDGFYYLATTTWSSELIMRKSPTLAGLKTAEPVQIYYETDPLRCCNMWAPEFYLLEGPDGPHWYFYYTAGIADQSSQHTHVLESAGTDPMGPYTYKARIFDLANDVWAIDGSILQLDGSLYFLYSAWIGSNQDIFIAPMSNPWTLSGSRVLLSEPTYDWERQGLNVNEGPVALQHDGDTFIIYSASFCGTPEYKLGMLTYVGDDPLDADSWEKHPEPVFQRSDENGVYGPAHNGFFMSPDGSEYWIVYHANDDPSEGCDNGRTTRAQPFTWNEDGTPNFGEPVSTETIVSNPSGDRGVDLAVFMQTEFETVRIQALRTGAYLRHAEYRARFDYTVEPIGDSEFYLVAGLADRDAISIMSANFPGLYLHFQDNLILLSRDDGSDEFAADATWWMRDGLADSTQVSFESYSTPGMYLMEVMTFMTQRTVNNDNDAKNATFLIE